VEDRRRIGLLQSLPERQEDVAWIDEREGMSDGRVGEKNADTFISIDIPEASTTRFYNIFTLIEIYELTYTLKVRILFNST